MNDDLVQRLHFAESDFLDALQNGPQMLASYRESLSALPSALSTAMKMGGTNIETLSLAHSVASRILNIASCYLRVKHEEEDFSAQLRADCDAMLHQMDTLNLDAQPKSSYSNGSRDTDHSSLTLSALSASDSRGLSNSQPPPAYRWLLDNLHNPYPTPEVKAQIAAASSCQVTSINSWFINARRRIGWTTLCREHFSNSRADMIDAAHRALVEEDSQRALSPGLQHLFVAMKVAAEDLYSSTLTRCTFSGDLDAIAKGITKENRKRRPADLSKAVQDSYPSPDPTVTASPVTAISDSLTDEGEEDEDMTSPVIAGSKRRRPSVEPADQPSTASRPIKRLRASVTSQTCLPSPPSSTDVIHESLHCGSPELLHAHSKPPDTNEVLPSRKRRLSDAEDIRMPKRLATPGLQTVPDPLPRSDMENDFSIDDWFHTNFDDLFAIPPPVEATAPDFSDATSWEVELFQDYIIPGEPKHGPERPPAHAPTAVAYIPSPSDLSDLDSLLQSIGSDFITPSDTLPPPTGTGTPSRTSLDSSMPDLSLANLDWTSLLSCTETYQPSVYSTFSQYPTDSQPLPEIDLSMLQLPQAMANVNSRGEPASKQAKLQQLQAMQEAVWRMEQELRSEGVVI